MRQFCLCRGDHNWVREPESNWWVCARCKARADVGDAEPCIVCGNKVYGVYCALCVAEAEVKV